MQPTNLARFQRPGVLLRRAVSMALTLPCLAATVDAQSTWSGDFGRPGVVGRVFELGTFQGQLIGGGLALQGGGHDLGLVARFDGSRWQPLGGGISAGGGQEVRAVLEWNGALYVGGFFCCAEGQLVSNLARWDGAQWSSVGGGVDGTVWALAEHQGDLIVAGQFTSAGGTPVQNIARWDGQQWHALGSGLTKSFDPEVHALRVGPAGDLFVAGEFDTAGGAPAANVAVWNGTSWSPLGSGLPGPLNGIIWDLEWYQSDLWACGNFDMLAGGTAHEKVAVWDGATWSAGGVFPDSSTATTVFDLEVVGADLWAGGDFTTASGVSVQRVARFDGAQWTNTGGVSSVGSPTAVLAVHDLNGHVYVGGELALAGFHFPSPQSVATESVAAYDGTRWEAVGLGLGFDHEVFDSTLWNGQLVCVGNFVAAGAHDAPDIVMLQGGDWVHLGTVNGTARSVTVWGQDLVIAGSFTSVSGVATSNAARFDGSTWHALSGAHDNTLEVFQGQLYSGGTGGVLRWNGASWQTFAPQLFGYVYDLHAHAGTLYIGGDMSSSANLVSWDGTTQQTVGGGTTRPVRALESFQGDLLVGGEFAQAGGSPANRLARWDGVAFHPVPGLTGLEVVSLAVFRGNIIASGHLVSNGLTPDKYIARFDGMNWTPLGLGLDGPAFTLTSDEALGHLYAGGNFRTADSAPAWYFARWDEAPPPLGMAYCSATSNSTGSLGSLTAHGSLSLAQNDLTLEASNLPQQATVFFLTSIAQALVAHPGGSAGNLCLGGAVGRYVGASQVGNTGPAGRYGLRVDLTRHPQPSGLVQVTPGQTWNFQAWHRDAAFGGGVTSNFTRGLQVGPFTL